MRQLILLYWGCVFLMYLSQVYYPTSMQLEGPQTGRRHFMLRKADMFMIAAIVWMTCFSFLRTSYNDTGTYIAHFMDSESVADYFARNGLLDWTGNPLSELYRDAMRDITTNHHIYFFFPAFLSSFAVVKLCKKYSVSPALSLLVFFSIGTYVMYIAALKQCFAMFFLLLALPYAIDKKYVRFYLLVFVAVLFHTHAFMFAIVPLHFSELPFLQWRLTMQPLVRLWNMRSLWEHWWQRSRCLIITPSTFCALQFTGCLHCWHWCFARGFFHIRQGRKICLLT